MPEGFQPSPAFGEKAPEPQEPNSGLSDYAFGKVPPQAKDLEVAVLGALMLDKNALSKVVDFLRPDSFYVDAHGIIYKSIQKLFEESQPIDILTVTQKLRNDGNLDKVGGAYYVSELANKVTSSAHVEYHSRIIAQKYIERSLIAMSTEIIKDAYTDTTDVFNLLDTAQSHLFEIMEQNLRRGYASVSDILHATLDDIQRAREDQRELTGVPSGIIALDRETNGWQPSDLIIVAGRPAMGKTSFVLSIARNAAVDHGHNVAIFSLEMSNKQLVSRLISSEAEIEMKKLRTGDLEGHEWQQLISKSEKLSSAGIYIDDTPALNVFELRAKCRRLKMQQDIGMIVVDYLQLMEGPPSKNKGNREQEISTISRSLKALAKELDVPVIALSQLSRAVEVRGGTKRPMLSDLRESGAIEQDADQVLFLYRPEYYGYNENEEGQDVRGLAEVIISKNRNGSVGSVWTRFIDKFTRFENASEMDMSAKPENSGPQLSGESNFKYLGSRMNESDEGDSF